jgi:hypothetical protein
MPKKDEADWLNLINQAVIGAKEGTAESITTKVGTDMSDAVLKTADGSDFRSVKDWQLKNVLTAVVQGADRPNSATSSRKSLPSPSFNSTSARKSTRTWNFSAPKQGTFSFMALPST